MIDFIRDNRNGKVGVVHLVDDIFRRIHGFFVDVDDQCVIVHLIESAAFCLNGWEAIRLDLIEEVNVYAQEDHWPNRACRDFRMEPEALPNDLSCGFVPLLKSFKKTSELVAIHCDYEDNDYEIGIVSAVSDDEICLKTVGPTGIWKDDATAIPTSTITRIGFRNRYLKALAQSQQ